MMLRDKFWSRILTVFSLIFCASVFSAAQSKPVDNAILVKFEKSIEQGNYAVERDLLNYVIANPKDAKGFELLGRLRFAQNRPNEAKSLFQKALLTNPGLVSAKINLAVIYFQNGNAAEANSLLEEITEGDAANDLLRLKLAEAFVIAGNCQKAFSVIEKLQLKIRNSDALPLRADCYIRGGEKQKVGLLIPLTKNTAKQNPSIAVKFAEVLNNGGMFKESADILRSVAAAAPQNFDVLISLAKSEISAKDFSNAKIHLNQAAKVNSNPAELFFVQGLLESETGNSAQSLALIEKSLEANPDSTTVLKQFVLSAIRAKQSGKAVKAAEKLLEIKPDEPEFLYLFGAASLQNNDIPAAENSLKRFVELSPQNSLGCLALGLTYAAQPEKLEIARSQFQHCVEINPGNFEAFYQLGLSYKTRGDNAKAIEYLEKATGISPDYAVALRDLGIVYLQTGAEIKARAALEKSALLSPNDADTHFQLSRLYNLIGEAALAKKHLEIFQKLKNPSQNGM